MRRYELNKDLRELLALNGGEIAERLGLDVPAERLAKRQAEISEKQARRVATSQRWREYRREYLRKYKNRWKSEHPEKCAEYRRRWLAKHPEYNAEYWAANADRINAKRREYCASHRDELRAGNRERWRRYYDRHHEEINARKRLKRAESK